MEKQIKKIILENQDKIKYTKVGEEITVNVTELLELVWKEAQKEVLEKIYIMFSERAGSTFCGCYEGDINEYYKPEIISFLKELREYLGIHNALMLLESKDEEDNQ